MECYVLKKLCLPRPSILYKNTHIKSVVYSYRCCFNVLKRMSISQVFSFWIWSNTRITLLDSCNMPSTLLKGSNMLMLCTDFAMSSLSFSEMHQVSLLYTQLSTSTVGYFKLFISIFKVLDNIFEHAAGKCFRFIATSSSKVLNSFTSDLSPILSYF